mmetsp:Transcript_2941/g.8576  ORF Transcript_2941/g.8576 Transcript_2941/m.8576 type:complete len:179 (-) Transcript_2941:22-558(-)
MTGHSHPLPGFDAAAMKGSVKQAEAALELACAVPLPSSDFDEQVRALRGVDRAAWTGAKGDESVCGVWASEKGESRIFRDHRTNRLSFEELVDDSGYLHGWLDKSSDGWDATLAFYYVDEEPWYGPSCGEEPEYMGDIRVRLLSETMIETQIKFADDTEWQPPVVMTLQHHEAVSLTA